MMRTRDEWLEYCVEHGFSGDQVMDILEDWKEELAIPQPRGLRDLIIEKIHVYGTNHPPENFRGCTHVHCLVLQQIFRTIGWDRRMSDDTTG